MTAPTVFLVAGEPSGDVIGGRLMAALKRRTGGAIRFAGIGGERMAAEGLESLFPMNELSVMGLVEILPKAWHLLRRIRQTSDAVLERRPDAVVTIDSPGFSLRLADRLAGHGIKRIHFVAPQVWAWRPGRAVKIARLLDHLLTLMPFEPPYFTRHGLACTFTGHPIVENGADCGDRDRFRAIHGIPNDAPLLCILPGSRVGEVDRLLPVFAETVDRLAVERPQLRAVVIAAPTVADRVRDGVSRWPVPTTIVEGDAAKYDAFAACDAALAASGTVTLELALAGAPMVVAYRANPVTAWIGFRLIKIPYVALVNVVLGRKAVPECLQANCRPDLLEAALAPLLDDPEAAAAQRRDCAEAARLVGLGGPPPSERAAEAVLKVIGWAQDGSDEAELRGHSTNNTKER